MTCQRSAVAAARVESTQTGSRVYIHTSKHVVVVQSTMSNHPASPTSAQCTHTSFRFHIFLRTSLMVIQYRTTARIPGTPEKLTSYVGGRGLCVPSSSKRGGRRKEKECWAGHGAGDAEKNRGIECDSRGCVMCPPSAIISFRSPSIYASRARPNPQPAYMAISKAESTLTSTLSTFSRASGAIEIMPSISAVRP